MWSPYHMVWCRHTEVEAWQAALDRALEQAEEGFEGTWSACSPPERAVLAAIATNEPVLSRHTLELYDVAKASAQTARDRLLNAGEHLTERDRTAVFVDPLLGEWIRRR